MARIPQSDLELKWDDIDAAPDLGRVKMLLQSLDDEAFMRQLERDRKGRRDEYPVRACWNIRLAALVLGHRSLAAMLRELKRNPSLRRAVGISVAAGPRGVPTKDAMCRFQRKLLERPEEVDRVREGMLERLRHALGDLGQETAVDATAIRTWARGRKDPTQSADPEARWGKKVRRWKDKAGVVHETETKWFGYKAHLLVDSRYELPLARALTPANAADGPQLQGLLDRLKEAHPEMRVGTVSGDKAYDDGDAIRRLYQERQIKAVFALRDTAQDGEDGEAFRPGDNVLLGDDGTVYCYHKRRKRLVRQAMVYWGWEAKRGTQKWRCPAAVYGLGCPERKRCSPAAYGKTVRVRAEQDWRRFGPIPHGTKKRKRLYNGRTAAERVNSRLKQGLALDELTVRGQAKIQLKLDLALLVLYGLALGHLRRKAKHWRSYTRIAD